MIEATLPRPDGVEIATYRWMPEGTPRGLPASGFSINRVIAKEELSKCQPSSCPRWA